MTEEQQNLIHLARMAAQSHLSIMISNPEKYLGTFRYGMDFVWGITIPVQYFSSLIFFSKMCLLRPPRSQTRPPLPFLNRHAYSHRRRKYPPCRTIQSARLQQHLLPHSLPHDWEMWASLQGGSGIRRWSKRWAGLSKLRSEGVHIGVEFSWIDILLGTIWFSGYVLRFWIRVLMFAIWCP